MLVGLVEGHGDHTLLRVLRVVVLYPHHVKAAADRWAERTKEPNPPLYDP